MTDNMLATLATAVLALIVGLAFHSLAAGIGFFVVVMLLILWLSA